MALTPQEDEELRRIHTLSQFGELPEIMQGRYDELRARDEHLVIAEPTLDITWLPTQRSREDGLDDRIDLYEDVDLYDDVAVVDGAGATGFVSEFERSHMSIADMAEFEAALSGNDFYAASPHTSGFAPSSWYGTN